SAELERQLLNARMELENLKSQLEAFEEDQENLQSLERQLTPAETDVRQKDQDLRNAQKELEDVRRRFNSCFEENQMLKSQLHYLNVVTDELSKTRAALENANQVIYICIFILFYFIYVHIYVYLCVVQKKKENGQLKQAMEGLSPTRPMVATTLNATPNATLTQTRPSPSSSPSQKIPQTQAHMEHPRTHSLVQALSSNDLEEDIGTDDIYRTGSLSPRMSTFVFLFFSLFEVLKKIYKKTDDRVNVKTNLVK
ncbi:hypothetical protein RFI_27539, partial [Reticulomyxa filosa]